MKNCSLERENLVPRKRTWDASFSILYSALCLLHSILRRHPLKTRKTPFQNFVAANAHSSRSPAHLRRADLEMQRSPTPRRASLHTTAHAEGTTTNSRTAAE